MILSMIQAKKWGPELFGWYSYLYTLIGIIGIIGDFGIDMVLTKYIAICKEGISRSFYLIKSLTITLCIVISMLIIWILEPAFRLAFALLALGVIFQSIISFLNGAIRGLEKLDIEAKLGTFQKAFFMIPSITTILIWNSGINPVCFLYTFSNLITLYLTILYLKNISKLCNVCSRLNKWKDVLRKSWPLLIINLVSFLSIRVDIMFAKWLDHPESVGIYSAIFRIIEGISFFSTAYTIALFPRLVTSSNMSVARKQVFLSSIILGVTSILVGIILWSLTSTITGGILSNTYDQSSKVLKILSLAIPPIFLGNLFGHVLIAMDRQKIYSLIVGLGIIFSFFVDIYTVPKLGVVGLSWSMFMRTMVICGLTCIATLHCMSRSR